MNSHRRELFRIGFPHGTITFQVQVPPSEILEDVGRHASRKDSITANAGFGTIERCGVFRQTNEAVLRYCVGDAYSIRVSPA